MTSTTVYLTEDQCERLDAAATRLRVPKAVLIRDGIDLVLEARALSAGAPLAGGVQEGEAPSQAAE